MSRAVIITGASTGIGNSAALGLAARGWKVFACARKPQDLEALAKASPNIHAVRMDVTSSEQIKAAARELAPILADFSEVSLINNAGIAVSGPMEAITTEKLRAQFDVNVFGLHEVTQAFLPVIRKSKGRVVNMSSVGGQFAPPFLGPYSSSKFAVESISDALRREMIPFGVKVVVIEPGMIATPIWGKNLDNKETIRAEFLADRIGIYEKMFENFIKYVEDGVRYAIPPERVLRALVIALEDSDPPVRMLVVSLRDWFRRRFIRLLPEKWADALVAKALKA